MCFVPWHVLSSSVELKKLAVRVEIRTLEGRGVAEALGARPSAELLGEVQCGPAADAPSRPSQQLLTVALLADAGRGGAGVRLKRAAGVAAAVFPLAQLDLRGVADGGGVACRVSLKQAGPRNIAVGEVCFAVPARAAGRAYPLEKLGAGLEGSSLRVDAGWVGIDGSTCVRLAGRLGEHLLDSAARSRWHEVAELAPLASCCGWEKSVEQQCSALVVGRADEKDAYTALRLCVASVGPSSPSGSRSTGSYSPPSGSFGGSSTSSAQVGAATALLEARADPHVVAKDGDSPLTSALRTGSHQLVSLLVSFANPHLVTAVGLRASPPWVRHPIDWEVLQSARAFALILFCAEHLRGTGDTPNGAKSSANNASNSAKNSALRDALFYAVSRRHGNMATRVVAAMGPIGGRASSADVLLLEQMINLATREDGDPRWFAVAEAQYRRGGPEAWRNAQRVVRKLAEEAAHGVEKAQQLMLEVAVPKRGRVASEPRHLFPERAAECAVCFEPLYENSPAFFLDEDRNRSCVHYVCAGCAEDCKMNKECPICRASAEHIAPLPSVELDPRGWFKAVSRSDGRIDDAELCHALAAVLPVSEERLLAAIEKEGGPWQGSWDKAETVSEEEFFAPDTGLFAWILAHLQELHHNNRRNNASLPDIRTDPVGWFDFWDERGAGSLSFGEVLRGVFVSRKMSALENREQLRSQRAEVKSLWKAAGLKADTLTREEFLRPEGLAERLSKSFQDTQVPKGSIRVAALPEPSSPQVTPVLPSASAPSPLGSAAASPTTSPPSRASPQPGDPPPLLPSTPSSRRSQPQAKATGPPPDPTLEMLEAMGFQRDMAVAALQQANGNAEQAVGILLQQ